MASKKSNDAPIKPETPAEVESASGVALIVTQEVATAEPKRDASGRLLDQWMLPVAGPDRSVVLAALDRPEPADAPEVWSEPLKAEQAGNLIEIAASDAVAAQAVFEAENVPVMIEIDSGAATQVEPDEPDLPVRGVNVPIETEIETSVGDDGAAGTDADLDKRDVTDA